MGGEFTFRRKDSTRTVFGSGGEANVPSKVEVAGLIPARVELIVSLPRKPPSRARVSAIRAMGKLRERSTRRNHEKKLRRLLHGG